MKHWDLLIIGGGPAGLAASCAAQDAGLSHLVIERRGLVQSLVEHPQQIMYFSPADEMTIGGVPFPIAGGRKPTREDALAYYRAVALSRRLPLATWEEVVQIEPLTIGPENLFRVCSAKREAGDGESVERYAHFLLVCTGTFPHPKRLTVPGAALSKVRARLDDPTPFFGRDVLVVGGGNSAATAAMTLADAGANVTIAMRRPPQAFQSHLRPFIVRNLTIMADERRLSLLTNVRVAAIEPQRVQLIRIDYEQDTSDPDAAVLELPNDFVFAMIGHMADAALFQQLGIALDADGLPVFNQETAESSIPGLYIAGSLSHANLIIEARARAVQVVERMASLLSSGAGHRLRSVDHGNECSG